MPRAARGASVALAVICAALPPTALADDYDEATRERVGGAIVEARYGLIIDAGSSGSRLRIYKISGPDRVAAVFPTPEDEASFETEPGISDFVERPEEVGGSLQGLLEAAKGYIPQDKHDSALLWVKATAGIRIVDYDLLSSLFDHLDAWMVKNCPFTFVNSEVLGGEEEALFAYISMNYLKGTLFLKPEQRVGILDMGGASLQIAHHPQKFVLADSYSFYVHGERRTVYATSQIKFGLRTAIERAYALLARSEEYRGADEIPFPCYNKGVRITEEVNGTNITFFGTSDNAQCSDITNRLLHRDYVCLMPPCPFMGIHMAPFNKAKRFYGISNYFYIANGLKLVGWNEQRVLTPRQIRNATFQLCEQDESEASSEGPPWKYRINHCFGGHYIGNILDAFGFGDDAKNVKFLRKYKGQAADWSLGAILYETQAMPLFLPSDKEMCKRGAFDSDDDVPVAKFELLRGRPRLRDGREESRYAGTLSSGRDGCLLAAGGFAGAFASVALLHLLAGRRMLDRFARPPASASEAICRCTLEESSPLRVGDGDLSGLYFQERRLSRSISRFDDARGMRI